MLRKNIESLIESIATVKGVEDVGLTTNGFLFDITHARMLKSAGLSRVTISLDALDQEVFSLISGRDFLVERVLEAIDTATTVGLSAKINMVVKRGVNDHQILPMARYFHGSGHILRFIEYMDVGTVNGWRMDDVFSASEIIDVIGAEMPIDPLQPNYRGEVAQRWRYRDGGGEIGIIASVTQPFCGDCNRVRLSAEGQIYTCLFATQGHNLRKALLGGVSDEMLIEWLSGIWRQRSDRYSELRDEGTVKLKKIEMSYIGG